jgi:hypothetical protein
MLTMLAVQADELPPPAYQLAAHDADIPSTVLFAIACRRVVSASVVDCCPGLGP